MADDDIPYEPGEESHGELEEIRSLYQDILDSAFQTAIGEDLTLEDEAALTSLQSSAERLAEQLQRSVLYAPWARTDIQAIINEWMATGDDLNLADLRAALEPIVGQTRALLIARTETGQAWNSAWAAGVRQAGFNYMRWIAAPDACPICAELDGKVMTVSEFEENSLPHPNCSCTGEPVDDEEVESEAA